MLKQHIQVGLTDEVRLKFSLEEDENISQLTVGKNFHQRIQLRAKILRIDVPGILKES